MQQEKLCEIFMLYGTSLYAGKLFYVIQVTQEINDMFNFPAGNGC